VNDAERVGDHNAVEPETAQEPIGGRLEDGTPSAAFCCGVIVISRAEVMSAATLKASVD